MNKKIFFIIIGSLLISLLIISITKPAKHYSYLDNPDYKKSIDSYSSEQKDIVLLGTSITFGVSWSELLNRNDVVNMGIGRDITEGFINRLKFVLLVKPKICFIEGGVNDIAKGISNDTIIKNLNSIIDTLKKNNIIPIMTAITLVSFKYKYAVNFNDKIIKLNKQISELATERKIVLINLNSELCNEKFLLPQYACEDGIHYTDAAYKIWSKEINKVLIQSIL